MNTQQLQLVSSLIGEGGLAILSTCGNDGMPHATWMNAFVVDGLREVVAITSPESRKALNLQQNSQAEWMFSSTSMETVAHLSGNSMILEEAEEAQIYWDMVPLKARGFYRHYRKPDRHSDFAIIRTQVSNIQLVKPMGYRKTEIAHGEVALPA